MPLKTSFSTPSLKKCGIPSSNSDKINIRITSNSEKTSIGELSWTVLLLDSSSLFSSKERNSFICGGSLIHPQVVITAGHCVATSKSESVKVRAGEWNIKNKDEPLPHQDVTVKEILLHPQYKPGTLWNDIALLILNQPSSLTENVGFICLPAGKFKVDERNCLASGWGRREMERQRLSAVLRKVTVPLVRKRTFQRALRQTKLGKKFRLHKSFICAGGERNRDTCKGEGGYPLICPVLGEEDRYMQVGIVSWGMGCRGNNKPGVYTSVALYVWWIEEKMKKNNFNISYYKM
ncbi:phenoloxidase-activating factor 2-like [Zophobas morio]|uniref:phenoloxidase-activating factor 2-like n=1 Tax=Zophobas morio TaxID=2755281 RepID=UPI0030832138